MLVSRTSSRSERQVGFYKPLYAEQTSPKRKKAPSLNPKRSISNIIVLSCRVLPITFTNIINYRVPYHSYTLAYPKTVS